MHRQMPSDCSTRDSEVFYGGCRHACSVQRTTAIKRSARVERQQGEHTPALMVHALIGMQGGGAGAVRVRVLHTAFACAVASSWRLLRLSFLKPCSNL